MNALSILAALLSSSPAFDPFPFSTSGASSFALASSNQNNALAFASGGGFNISGAAALCASLPTHSWEYGAATLALLELYTPWASVYGMKDGAWNIQTPATVSALSWIVPNEGGGANALIDGEGSTGDPASLGILAWMIGKYPGYELYATVTEQTITYLMTGAPRYDNGAISHRADVAELWADFMYMAPPFLAFYGADTQNASLIYEGYNQCKLYREVLQSTGTGAWSHIIGPQSYDPGHWSTGNGWAAAGMSRVLATIKASGVATWEGQDATWWASAETDLLGWITEILDAVVGSQLDNGLVKNYLDTDGSVASEQTFGEISGSSAIASVIYRLAPSLSASYITWADGIRAVLGGVDEATGEWFVSQEGRASPAIDPLAWGGNAVEESPEGQAFVVMMYSAWRDCVLSGHCSLYGGLLDDGETQKRDTVHGSDAHRRRRNH
ncbi:hypothetical protein BDZ89DRAFT_945434 [Hymenopellis radicata]|nr:hypothetical protein BDZ89DRAFT_945434 [Hymenopellis radicata]